MGVYGAQRCSVAQRRKQRSPVHSAEAHIVHDCEMSSRKGLWTIMFRLYVESHRTFESDETIFLHMRLASNVMLPF
jgi:hypothetical protein